MAVCKSFGSAERWRLWRFLMLLVASVLALTAWVTPAFAATSNISDLISSTHPDDTWRASSDASFAWRQKMNFGSSETARLPLFGAQGIAIHGDLAYVVRSGAFSVVDISDPSQPVEVGKVGLPASIFGWGNVAVAGNMACVAGNGQARLIDVSDPAHPSLRGAARVNYSVDVTAVSETMFYVSDNSGQIINGVCRLWVMDASDPDAPKVTTQIGTGYAYGISSVSDNRIAVATSEEVQFFDVSNPAQPVLLGSLPDINQDECFTDVELVGDTAYCLSLPYGLVVVDLTNPASPLRIAAASAAVSPQGVDIVGDRAYVADQYGGVFIFDISDPLQPTLTGPALYLPGAQGMAVEGRHAYVAGSMGLSVIDVWEPAEVRPTQATTIAGSNTYDVTAAGGLLFVPKWSYGFEIWNVGSPAAPAKLSSFNTDGNVSAIAVRDDHAFVLDGLKGLKTFDISNPASPKQVARLTDVEGSGNWDKMIISGDLLIVGGHTNYWTPTKTYSAGIRIIDISDPLNLRVLKIVGGMYSDVDVSGDLLYAVQQYGMDIVDISRPESSTVIGRFSPSPAGGSSVGISVEGDTVYLAGEGNGVRRIDVSDPRAPRELGLYQGQGDPVGIDTVGDTVYVAGRWGGLDVVDFSDPLHPISLGRCDTPGDPLRVVVDGTSAYMPERFHVSVIPDLPRAEVEYSWELTSNPSAIPDGEAEGRLSKTSFTDLPDGEHYFKVRPILDGVGRATETRKIRIDTTVPSTTATATAGWSGCPATVSLASTDIASGVATTWYRIGSGGQTLYEGPFTVSAPGRSEVSFWSVDRAGNSEPVKTAEITVDAAPPVLTHNAPSGWVNHPVDVTVSASDAMSEVGAIDWKLSGAQVATGTAQASSTIVHVASEGVCTLEMAAADVAGNRSDPTTTQVRIDTTKPTVKLAESGSLGYAARFEISGSDALSGVTLCWRVDSGEVKSERDTTAIVTWDASGSHTIEAWSVDGAGNESSRSILQFHVQAPLGTITVAGPDRFATAVEVSKQAFTQGSDTVVIATGMNWPDALGGGALAGAMDAPVLLVMPDAIPAVTAAEIKRLGAKDAVILGGRNAVTEKVAIALKTAVSGEVTRIGGANRDRTAELVAARTRAELGDEFDGTVFVASDMDYSDAVAAGPMAARNGWPLYLAQPGASLSTETKTALSGVSRVIILGGESDVSAATKRDLVSLLGAQNVERVSGTDRYTDVVAIATYAVEKAGFSWNRIGITTGLDFPDALTGGVLQARAGAVMVMTPPNSLHPAVARVLRDNTSQIKSITFFGGINAINRDVRDAVQGASR